MVLDSYGIKIMCLCICNDSTETNSLGNYLPSKVQKLFLRCIFIFLRFHPLSFANLTNSDWLWILSILDIKNRFVNNKCNTFEMRARSCINTQMHNNYQLSDHKLIECLFIWTSSCANCILSTSLILCETNKGAAESTDKYRFNCYMKWPQCQVWLIPVPGTLF